MKVSGKARIALLALAVTGLLAVPAMMKAAGLDLTVNVGADDNAHFDFKGGKRHHHPEIWKAAKQLQNAKHTLWEAADDFNGHKADAIGAINAALDQLSICEQK